MTKKLWFPLFLGASIAGAHFAHALVVKPNIGPVINSAIPATQQYVGTIGVIDLSASFSDPDATAAVQITTSLGTMNLTLDGQTAPLTVANFLNYVDSQRYFKTDPTSGQRASLFVHRSVANFVIQTGGFLGTVNPNGLGDILATQVATFPPVQNEPFISNKRGTIAMAKTSLPNSATSQWFVNLVDNTFLDDPSNPNNTGGFTVFGRVAGDGMNVANAIAALPRINAGAPFDSLPVRNYTSGNVKLPNVVSLPGVVRISPFVFSASSNNTAVADVRTGGNYLVLDAHQLGSAQITVTATDLDGASVSQSFNMDVIAAPARLLNISTRANFPVGNETLTAGFFVKGGPTTQLVVRAVSTTSHVENPLRDMALEVLDGAGHVVASNDNWGDSPDADLLRSIPLAPDDPLEAAVFVKLPASASDFTSYTVRVRSVDGQPGRGLVEVFTLDSGPGSTLQNISTLGPVGRDADVLIGGFIVGGNGFRRLVVRGVGPSLASRNVQGVLANPRLELYNSQNQVIVSNDDWQNDPAVIAELQSYGVAPEDSREAAVIASLPAGAYTAKIIGVDGTTGIGQVEVFQVQ